MFNIMIALNPSLTRVLITSIVLGFLAGSFGVFIILKKQALAGDSIAHATLPGVVITFLIFQTKQLEILLIGAVVSAIIAIFLLNIIKKYSKIKNDAILALILAGFFGLGRTLLSVVQRRSGSGAAGLENFIFGQAATILLKDMILIIGIGVITQIIITLFWKELKLSIFDPEYFQTSGFNSRLLNIIFSILLVLVVVAGIQMVGIVLISALLVAPGVAARQWSHRLSINFFIAGIIGAISGGVGVLIADSYSLPPGPMIIVILSIITIISLLFTPKNGIIMKTIKDVIFKNKLNKYAPLINFHQNKKIDQQQLTLYIDQGLIIKKDQDYLITNRGIIIIEQITGGKNHD